METLKEFKKIMLGQKSVSIHTTKNHRTNNTTPRVMRWRLLIEEFGPKLIYLPGVNNIVADCLSILEYKDNNNIMDHFALGKEDVNAYLLRYMLIMKYQQRIINSFKKVKMTKCTVYVPSLQQDVHVP